MTLAGHAFVTCVALLCGAGLVPTLVEADSIRHEACSCYAECNNGQGVGSAPVMRRVPFFFGGEEKMDGLSGKEMCGGTHESARVALDPTPLRSQGRLLQ